MLVPEREGNRFELLSFLELPLAFKNPPGPQLGFGVGIEMTQEKSPQHMATHAERFGERGNAIICFKRVNWPVLYRFQCLHAHSYHYALESRFLSNAEKNFWRLANEPTMLPPQPRLNHDREM